MAPSSSEIARIVIPMPKGELAGTGGIGVSVGVGPEGVFVDVGVGVWVGVASGVLVGVAVGITQVSSRAKSP